MSDETPSNKELLTIYNAYYDFGTAGDTHPDGLRAVFNAGRASVTPPTIKAIREAEKEAVRLLKPKQFRVIKREIGFTVETPVVDYWEAVRELARALAVPSTESEGKK
jgi:hypothetical protein